MKRIAKLVNGLKALTIFVNRFILDVWKGSECTSGGSPINSFQPSFAFHRETGHLFCSANQMAGNYILKATLGWNVWKNFTRWPIFAAIIEPSILIIITSKENVNWILFKKLKSEILVLNLFDPWFLCDLIALFDPWFMTHGMPWVY